MRKDRKLEKYKAVRQRRVSWEERWHVLGSRRLNCLAAHSSEVRIWRDWADTRGRQIIWSDEYYNKAKAIASETYITATSSPTQERGRRNDCSHESYKYTSCAWAPEPWCKERVLVHSWRQYSSENHEMHIFFQRLRIYWMLDLEWWACNERKSGLQ